MVKCVIRKYYFQRTKLKILLKIVIYFRKKHRSLNRAKNKSKLFEEATLSSRQQQPYFTNYLILPK